MSIYVRKLAKGLRYWYKFDHNGVTYHSKAIYESKQEAKRAEGERLTTLKQPSKMTILELCNNRLDYIQAAKTDSYYKFTKQLLSPFAKKFGRMRVEDLSKRQVHDYLLDLSKRLKKEDKDNYQVNKTIRALKAMFYYAVDTLEILDKNPIKGIKPYPVDKKLKYIPPDAHLVIVCDHLNDDQQKLLEFVKATGCRIGEALRAKAEDIGENVLTLWTRKNKLGNLEPRRIPLPEAVRGLKLPVEGRLFPEWSSYPRFLEDACLEAKIKLFGWHALRHRRASQLVASGMNLLQIRDYFGHQDISTTNIYLQQLGFFLGYDFHTESRESGEKTGQT